MYFLKVIKSTPFAVLPIYFVEIRGGVVFIFFGIYILLKSNTVEAYLSIITQKIIRLHLSLLFLIL